MHASSSQSPQGFQYLPDWISLGEEQDLLANIETLEFSEVRMHGVVAKRRVIHFGWHYGYESWTVAPTQPIPHWLLPLRTRAADLMQEPVAAVEEILVTCYESGAGIGWHRDAPMFGSRVVGVSLLGSCRMRFQRKSGGHRETTEAFLAPRSAYLLAGAARATWQHSIPATKQLRYSITFRTIKHSRTHIQGFMPGSDKAARDEGDKMHQLPLALRVNPPADGINPQRAHTIIPSGWSADNLHTARLPNPDERGAERPAQTAAHFLTSR
jgi:DNA oxidative demethylase